MAATTDDVPQTVAAEQQPQKTEGENAAEMAEPQQNGEEAAQMESELGTISV